MANATQATPGIIITRKSVEKKDEKGKKHYVLLDREAAAILAKLGQASGRGLSELGNLLIKQAAGMATIR